MKKVGIKTFMYAGSYPAKMSAINEKLDEARKEHGDTVEPLQIDNKNREIYYTYEN